MSLTSSQREQLLLADRHCDAATMVAAASDVLRESEATLLDAEMALRNASTGAYLIAAAGKFEVIIGVRAMCGRLATLGLTPAQNREALAIRAASTAAMIG